MSLSKLSADEFGAGMFTEPEPEANSKSCLEARRGQSRLVKLRLLTSRKPFSRTSRSASQSNIFRPIESHAWRTTRSS